jgi:hypothetical protein
MSPDPVKMFIRELTQENLFVFLEAFTFNRILFFHERGNAVRLLFFHEANERPESDETLNFSANALFPDRLLPIYGDALLLSNKSFTSSIQLSNSSHSKPKKKKKKDDFNNQDSMRK